MGSFVHRVIINNLCFLLTTCLLQLPKEQMLEVPMMAINKMLLHPHLPLTPYSPLPCHPFQRNVARLEPAPIYTQKVGMLENSTQTLSSIPDFTLRKSSIGCFSPEMLKTIPIGYLRLSPLTYHIVFPRGFSSLPETTQECFIQIKTWTLIQLD